MSGFATWLAGHRIRRVVIIAGLFPLPLLGLLSAATVVMSASLRGPREILLDCLMALALLVALSLVSGMDTVTLATTAAVSWAVWGALGCLAGRSGSLALTAQVAVLLALVGLTVFALATGDPVDFWLPVIQSWYAELGGELSSQGLTIPADLEGQARILEGQARIMSGGLFAFLLSGSMLSLLLGLSWSFGLTGRSVSDSFRELRLGYVIGGLAAVAGVLGLAGMQLHGALLVFGAAFTYQGVAVVMWWARERNWPHSWWLALVIPPLLFFGLLVVELAMLAAIGFVDNWFSLRRSAARPAV